MTELERRALLGDRKAQEECTRQGIALPCPCCGEKWRRLCMASAYIMLGRPAQLILGSPL